MAPDEEGRASPESGNSDFDGRDLLVDRPEGAESRSVAEPAKPAPTPPPPASPQLGAHDEAIGEILATVQTIAARLDALHDTPGPEHETAEALARETAALTQASRTPAVRSSRRQSWPGAGTEPRRDPRFHKSVLMAISTRLRTYREVQGGVGFGCCSLSRAKKRLTTRFFEERREWQSCRKVSATGVSSRNRKLFS